MISWQSLVDILVLAAALYYLLLWARGARALRLALALIAFYAAGLVARHLGLIITSWILSVAAVAAVALLIILFQPEIRRALMGLDALMRSGLNPLGRVAPAFPDIAEAAFSMAQRRIGALLVIARKDAIDESVSGGLPFGAEVSTPALEAVFERHSPLHDGAAVIVGRRIVRVGAVLPLTEREDVPEAYGTRHRAAMGLAERTDGLVVVVSEERGVVTLMQGQAIHPLKDRTDFVRLLESLHSVQRLGWRARLRTALTTNRAYKLAALATAVFIWWVSLMGPRTSVRTAFVPIEFRNVSADMEILDLDVDRIEVQLRGSLVSIDTLDAADLAATFNLRGLSAGRHVLTAGPGNLNPPPGVTVDRVNPSRLRIRLAKRRQ